MKKQKRTADTGHKTHRLDETMKKNALDRCCAVDKYILIADIINTNLNTVNQFQQKKLNNQILLDFDEKKAVAGPSIRSNRA